MHNEFITKQYCNSQKKIATFWISSILQLTLNTVMNIIKWMMALAIFQLYSLFITAQTPIANRINVAARHLPKDAIVIAKYTDNERHCLFYCNANRIYCLDVILNINEQLSFAQKNNEQILATYLTPDRRLMLFSTDWGNNKSDVLEERFQLWSIDSYNRQFKKIAKGFTIDKTREGFTIRRRSRCINPKAPKAHHRWMVQDLQFDLNGRLVKTGQEYEFIRKK